MLLSKSAIRVGLLAIVASFHCVGISIAAEGESALPILTDKFALGESRIKSSDAAEFLNSLRPNYSLEAAYSSSFELLESGGSGVFNNRAADRGVFRSDGSRLAYSSDAYVPSSPGSNDTNKKIYNARYLWDGKTSLSATFPYDSAVSLGAPRARVSVQRNAGSPFLSDTQGESLLGNILPGEHFVDTLLRADELRMKKLPAGENGANETLEFDASVREGTMHVKLKQLRNGHFALTDGAFSFDRDFIDKWQLDMNGPESYKVDQFAIALSLEDYQIEPDGTPVPRKMVRDLTGRHIGSNPFHTRVVVTRSEIVFNPTFGPDAFKLELPDGTEVMNADLDGTLYEWKNGKLGRMTNRIVDRSIKDVLRRFESEKAATTAQAAPIDGADQKRSLDMSPLAPSGGMGGPVELARGTISAWVVIFVIAGLIAGGVVLIRAMRVGKNG